MINQAVIKIVILFLALMSCQGLYAKIKLTESQKQLEKSLKKELNLKVAEFKETDSGYKYIILETKEKNKLIADSMGKIIFPIDKTILCKKIEYLKPGTFFDWTCSPLIKDLYKYGSFKAETEIGNKQVVYYIDFDGNVINAYRGDKIKFQDKDSLSIVEVVNNGCAIYGLMTYNGIEVLPTDYNTINLNSHGAILSKTDGWGGSREGALIFNSQKEFIPCKFFKVNYEYNEWSVQPHRIDKLVLYAKNVVYDCEFHDNGQILFEQGRYNDVIEYYKTNISTDSISYLYVGISKYHCANSLFNSVINKINTPSPTKPIQLNEELKLKEQLLKTYQQLKGAIAQLNIYLSGQASIYFLTANDYISMTNDVMVEIEVKYDNFRELVQAHNERYHKIKAKRDREESERIKKQAPKDRVKRNRQQKKSDDNKPNRIINNSTSKAPGTHSANKDKRNSAQKNQNTNGSRKTRRNNPNRYSLEKELKK